MHAEIPAGAVGFQIAFRWVLRAKINMVDVSNQNMHDGARASHSDGELTARNIGKPPKLIRSLISKGRCVDEVAVARIDVVRHDFMKMKFDRLKNACFCVRIDFQLMLSIFSLSIV